MTRYALAYLAGALSIAAAATDIYHAIVNACLPRCTACGRSMYRGGADLDLIRDDYPWRHDDGTPNRLGAVDWIALNRDYGWQSAWEPTMCRQCDTAHDHRQSPSFWYRIMRRVRR